MPDKDHSLECRPLRPFVFSDPTHKLKELIVSCPIN
jgi:hypothetical protein